MTQKTNRRHGKGSARFSSIRWLGLLVLLRVGSTSARGYGGRPSPTPPRPSPTPPRPSFPSGPSFPSPSWPTLPTPRPPSPTFPTFPSPSYPTFPSPSYPTFPSPTYPTFPSPSHPSVPTPRVPTHPHGSSPPTGNGNDKGCYERPVNTTTDALTNETETSTEVICDPTSFQSSSQSSGISVAGIVVLVMAILAVLTIALYFILRQWACREAKQGAGGMGSASHEIPVVLAQVVNESESWTAVRERVRQDTVAAQRYGFPIISKPLDGTYEAEYEEGGNVLHATFRLSFVGPSKDKCDDGDPSGWTIQGAGHDADGDFTVIEGLLSPTGMVYWIDECSQGKTLSEGRFNREGTALEGTWQAANGVQGTYRRFTRTDGNDTEPSDEDDDEEIGQTFLHDEKDEEPEICVQAG